MEIRERLSPDGAPEDQIRELEGRLGASLPADYRTFLSEVNGGRPEPTAFEGPSGDGSVVHFFFTLDQNSKYYNIYKEYAIYKDRIPDGLFPIACDDFGNLILLDLGARRPNAILFWDHENESPDGNPYWDNISFISESFDEFVGDLH